MNTTHALWVAGIVIGAAAIWFAWKSKPTATSNTSAMAGATPPPQKIGGPSSTLTIPSFSSRYAGALIVGGLNYPR